MKNHAIEEDTRLLKARELVQFLEQSNEEEALRIIDDITNVRSTELFNSIGHLTRNLHDSLSGVDGGDNASNPTEFDIPDAKERLTYVVTMTEQAADKTLSVIEELLPRCDQLHDRSARLASIWRRYAAGDMPEDEFHSLSDVIRTFLNQAEVDSDEMRVKLKEVLIAQEYQDITGQVIGRVIRLIEDVELSLMKVLRLTGSDDEKRCDVKSDACSGDELAGPQIPGHKSLTAVSGQDEVDDLLSSLGF